MTKLGFCGWESADDHTSHPGEERCPLLLDPTVPADQPQVSQTSRVPACLWIL